MFRTKKQVDEFVDRDLGRARSDQERQRRSFQIAKLYYDIKEFEIAEYYLCCYLDAKKDNFEAYNILGKCCEHLKKPRQALEWFQESLNLNGDQLDLLDAVCRLLDEDKTLNISQAEFWYDFAELHKKNHDIELPIRLQLIIKQHYAEVSIREKIKRNPTDMQLRVLLMRHYIDMNKMLEVVKYFCSIELNMELYFESSGEWYDKVGAMLGEFAHLPIHRRDWEFWLTMVMCLDRQVFLSFFSGYKTIPETAELLLNLDQFMFKITRMANQFCEQEELVVFFVQHYRGQLLLYAAALLLKRELVQSEHKWTETLNAALPLLLLAFQTEVPDIKEEWIQLSEEYAKQLTKFWIREGSFRCAQAGRTLLSCIAEGNLELINTALPANECKNLLARIRKTCSDKYWRQKVFSMLFPDCPQNFNERCSLFMNMKANPLFLMPKYHQVERFEEASLYLKPQSLEHMVYLHMSSENLAYITAECFMALGFSTPDFVVCGSESLYQLDVDTFLYAAIIQAKRSLDTEFESFENCNESAALRPRVLPFVNLQGQLCTEAQRDWWLTAYQFYKNISHDYLTALRRKLQSGIEVIRGLGGPKPHMIIMFKLGQIFAERAENTRSTERKKMLEARAEFNYKYGLKIFNMKDTNVIEPYFKYANANTLSLHRRFDIMYKEANLFLAERCEMSEDDVYYIEECADIQENFLSDNELDKVNKTTKEAELIFGHPYEDHSNANSGLSDTESSAAEAAETSFITAEDERKLKNLIQVMAHDVKFLTTEIMDIVIPEMNRMGSEIKALDLRMSNVLEEMKRMRLVKFSSRQNPSNVSQMTVPHGAFSNTSGNIFTSPFLPNKQQQQQQNNVVTTAVYKAPILYPNYILPQAGVANGSVAGLIGQGSVPYINNSINLNLTPEVNSLQPPNQSTSGSFCDLPNQQS